MSDSSLVPSELRPRLRTRSLAGRIFYWPSVDSTNRVAAKLAAAGEAHGTLVLTNHQTQGRGRQGRGWANAAGRDLAFSLILRPELQASAALSVTLAFSTAVAEAVEAATGVRCDVKWPNDVQCGGRKLCGILSESATEGTRMRYVVVGIGINVNAAADDFPHEIQGAATSCAMLAGGAVDRADVLGRVLNAADEAYHAFSKQGFATVKARYLARLAMLNQAVTFTTGDARMSATVTGVGDDGALLVVDAAGNNKKLYDEEVHIGAT